MIAERDEQDDQDDDEAAGPLLALVRRPGSTAGTAARGTAMVRPVVGGHHRVAAAPAPPSP